MAARSYLAMLSLALATYLGRAQALYTGASGNETSLKIDSLAIREHYVVYGDTNAQLDEQDFDAARAGNGTAQDLARRDVWSPKIVSPSSATVWVAGTTVEVTWDASTAPEAVTNADGKLLLGHVDDGSDENLDVDHPLAQGFDLHEGSVQVEVPRVRPGNDYIVVLMGDSGNRSPTFTIN